MNNTVFVADKTFVDRNFAAFHFKFGTQHSFSGFNLLDKALGFRSPDCGMAVHGGRRCRNNKRTVCMARARQAACRYEEAGGRRLFPENRQRRHFPEVHRFSLMIQYLLTTRLLLLLLQLCEISFRLVSLACPCFLSCTCLLFSQKALHASKSHNTVIWSINSLPCSPK